MLMLFGCRAELDVACDVRFILCSIRAVYHQVIVARCGIGGDYDVVVVYMVVLLAVGIVIYLVK